MAGKQELSRHALLLLLQDGHHPRVEWSGVSDAQDLTLAACLPVRPTALPDTIPSNTDLSQELPCLVPHAAVLLGGKRVCSWIEPVAAYMEDVGSQSTPEAAAQKNFSTSQWGLVSRLPWATRAW